jgi:hypothetical protein
MFKAEGDRGAISILRHHTSSNGFTELQRMAEWLNVGGFRRATSPSIGESPPVICLRN